ncbi:hypothetical protein KAFR_0C04210 [Kazachstania africana CBS 2517]|uniref:Large ribosomal subunit protein mL54 n=1 Tax=Kazachstania africana (strain ATCC 22294 / BCRC 22015 / CBS 2517 / CECT 1963 / NBRC 1671 / NRRL Y-8276) TaxID=1071382 RepID=H2ASR2_KAZAF|nr:hypothetical protein KAFR_0C04210 [Kazachstania africana CBS 2517]CCF57412.1 hypothetical protein KAFR_0C04210 [Kazachstania africana CBS 2517]
MLRLSRRFFSHSRSVLQSTKCLLVSSCPEGTPLKLGVRKGQKPPLALKDEEYPGWLWSVLNEESANTQKELSPIQELELRRKQLRKLNRDKIKQKNFLSEL